MFRLAMLNALMTMAAMAGPVPVTGTDNGSAPQVNVFDRHTLQQIGHFSAYPTSMLVGVRVAAGGGGHVRVFDRRTHPALDSFFAFGPSFTGGVYVAGGSAIVSAGEGMRSTVQIYDAPGGVPSRTLYPYGDFTGGVFAATSADVPEPGTWFLCSGFFGLLWIAAVIRPRKR
jgi:hypothetical protein